MGAQDSLIPGDLVSLLLARRMLFLGYGLRDWNLRVLLDRLTQLRSAKLKSYAITQGVSDVERTLWSHRSVAVYDAELGKFVTALRGQLAMLTAAGGA
jgi:SIR2-like domain